jgi:tryptophan-rich sensory protein
MVTVEGKVVLSFRRQTLGLIVSIIICVGVAGLGGLVTDARVSDWYAQRAKPEWTPPDWVFGPVWTVLYICMAVAVWLVWRQGGIATAKVAVALFAAQLVLNGLWSILFFGFQQPGIAAIEIVLMWAAILATIVAFWNRSTPASLLLVPYLAWVAFAVLLNWTIWQMNA